MSALPARRLCGRATAPSIMRPPGVAVEPGASTTIGSVEQEPPASDRLCIQRVACRAHRSHDVELPLAVDRLAKAPDMHIDRARFDMNVATPDRVQQLLAREYAAG